MEHGMRNPRTGYRRNDLDTTSRIVANDAYLAYVKSGRLIVRDTDDHSIVQDLPVERWATAAAINRYVISRAFSNKLALSARSTVHIIDVENSLVESSFDTGARGSTSLCWSPHTDQLACGSIDGALSIWDTTASKACSLASCRPDLSAVHCIAWSQDELGLIAFANSNGLYLWLQAKRLQKIIDFSSHEDIIQHLTWSQHHPQTLLGTSKAGIIYIWDLATVVSTLQKCETLLIDAVQQKFISMSSKRAKFTDIVYIQWVSEQKAAFLFEEGKKFALIDLRSPKFGSIDWELGFSHAFRAFLVQSMPDRDYVRVLRPDKQRVHPLPGKRDGAVTPEARDIHPLVPRRTLQRMSQHSSTAQHRTMSPAPITRVATTQRDIRRRNASPLRQTTNIPIVTASQLLTVENESPMPFLSPAIPAKTPMQSALPTDALALPSTDAGGYFGSFSSASLHDSDSDDDDTFGIEKVRKQDAHLSSNVINVALPRTCGAVFGHNGALVVFHLPRPKPAVVARGDIIVDEIESSHQDQPSTVALFPAFGNLLSSVFLKVTESQQDTASTLMSSLGLDRASYKSQQAWKPQSLSTGLPQTTLPPTMHVSVQTLPSDVCLPDRQLAICYRVLVSPGESGTTMCLTNAGIAIDSGRSQDAIIWQMLAKIIEDGEHRAATLWANHPLGSSWLVRRLFALAEVHGNVQMLANIIAVLIGSVDSSRVATLGGLASRMAVRPMTSTQQDEPRPTVAIPKLKTDIIDGKSPRRSPSKANASSAMSSRNTSLPTTPRLESSSSTPPWSFSSLTQARAPVANSISPETSRGSFSAAVKSYAQSVSDKLASYGTSPPIRKSVSPNELSSSLQSSSWTKSVSFASTTTRRTSTLSRRNTDIEDGYDSDRTIEDAIIVQESGVGFVWKNKDAFSDMSTGTAKMMLIPADLLPKCSVWIDFYVQQLRSWELDRQAVEMAKIGSLLRDMLDAGTDGRVMSITSHTELVVCDICTCLIEGLEQICTDCRHAYHLTCLGDLGDGIGSFQCPSDRCAGMINLED